MKTSVQHTTKNSIPAHETRDRKQMYKIVEIHAPGEDNMYVEFKKAFVIDSR